jgi:hypothetical protein
MHPEVLLTLNSPGGSIITILSTTAIDFHVSSVKSNIVIEHGLYR